MTFNIIPYVTVGPLRFGMERSEIQALLGQKSVPFNPNGKVECDYFDSLGILVEYDEDIKCSYIGLSKPMSALYKGKDLLSLNFEQIIKLLEDDSNIEKRSDGFISYLHGVGAVFENKKSPVTSVTLFKEGYYSKEDEWKRKLETLNLDEMSDEDLEDFINNG